MIISISGPICTGKTTLSKMLAERLQCSELSAGVIYRQYAKDAGMSIEDFMKQESSNKNLAQDVDTMIINQAITMSKHGHDVIINGRLNNHLLTMYFIPGIRICLNIDTDTMIRRFSLREDCGEEMAERKVFDRLKEDAKLFHLYGLEPWSENISSPYGFIPVYDVLVENGNTYDGFDDLISYIEHRRSGITYEKVSYL